MYCADQLYFMAEAVGQSLRPSCIKQAHDYLERNNLGPVYKVAKRKQRLMVAM